MYIIKKENVTTYVEYSSPFNGLSVVEFGKEKKIVKNETPTHRNNFIVHFVTKGKGIFNCDDKTYYLSEGDAFVITPSNLVSYFPSSDDGWSYCWINLSGIDCVTFFQKSGLLNKTVFTYENDDIKELLVMLDEIDNLDLSLINQDTYSLKVLGMAINVLERISLKLKKAKNSNEVIKNESILENAIEYINSKFTDNISISGMCKDINVSRAYFTTLFTKKMNQSPGQYLISKRIQYACEILLEVKSLKISKVAEMCGFQSTAQFCKCFKKAVMLSPKEYREGNGL